MTELSCRRLYVNGVDRNMKNGELVSHFKKFGQVIDVYNSLRGYAFVTFQNKDSAAMARREMDKTTMDGRIISVKFARTNSSSDSVRDPGVLVGYGSLDRGVESESESRGGGGVENTENNEETVEVNVFYSLFSHGKIRDPGGLVGYGSLDRGGSESESRGGGGDSVGCDDRNYVEMLNSVYHLGGIHGDEVDNTENIEETIEVKQKEKKKKRVIPTYTLENYNPKLETIEDEGSMEENNDQSIDLSNAQWFQWLQSKGSDLGEFEVKGETIGWLPPDTLEK